MNRQERGLVIKKLHNEGFTLRKIGKDLNISGERVRQILIWVNKGMPIVAFNNVPGGLSLLTGIKKGSRDRIRELIRIRDNHTCQKCGKKWIIGTRRFDVHHEDENMEGKSHVRGTIQYDRENMDKMITLCHKCHLNLDSVKRKMLLNRLTPNPIKL